MSHNQPEKCNDFRVIFIPSMRSRSTYRLVTGHNEEVVAVNEFLDATAVRALSQRTLRTYAYALLSVWKWMSKNSLSIEEMTELHLIDYIRHLREQADIKSLPAPRSINLRLGVMRSFYRFHTASQMPKNRKTPHEPPPLMVHSHRVGSCKPLRRGRPSLRVKVPNRLIIPLTRTEVIRFFDSFRTWRDLGIVSLMLFCGLRSREVLSLTLKDLDFIQEELRVRGKGDKDRILPLAPYTRKAISSYLRVERPETEHDFLFVNLKGQNRGNPMTLEGLRELFRYHRKRTRVEKANPHRFRHTFASDMVREGVPLPVLMRLMGHTQIHMTMRYVNLSAEDVRQEFERALRRNLEQSDDGKSLPSNP